MIRWSVCLLSLLSTAVIAADMPEALYRQDQPQVLSSQANDIRVDEAAVINAFRSSWVAAGNPRMAVFWDRELSDSITSTQEAGVAYTSTGVAPWDNHSGIIRITTRTGSERAVSFVAPARSAEFASGFQRTLRAGGVVFVDREAIVRLTSLKKTGSGTQASAVDFQTLEMEALAGFARFLVELNMLPDPDSVTGYEPRVTVIDTRNGEVVADVVPADLYKADARRGQWTATDQGLVRASPGGSGKWVADENGIHREIRQSTGVEEGQQVALELMRQLSGALSQ